MKNVKVILISVVLCAAVFANSRIDALGGDAGFWAGDKANIGIFPATINDHDFVEIDGVGDDGDGDTSFQNILSLYSTQKLRFLGQIRAGGKELLSDKSVVTCGNEEWDLRL